MKSFFSTMHEYGHGLYSHQLPRELERLPTGSACSLGIHESQSRLWENLVGRSPQFWRFFYPRVQETYPEQLGGVELDRFVAGINRVKPSLIRIKADEVTYGMHIILRFELEQDIINGRVELRDLPQVWNERMRDYLGVDVPDDAHGVLQDTHWASGLIGYFPTYLLGSVMSVQIWEKALEDVPDLEDQIERGEFARCAGGSASTCTRTAGSSRRRRRSSARPGTGSTRSRISRISAPSTARAWPPSRGRDPGVREPAARLGQVLRQHLHVREHRHEVRVAGPARHDVQVDVVDHAGAGDPAEVPADVVPLRRVELCQRAHAGGGQAVELEHFLGSELAVFTDVPDRRDHEVAGRIRVLVQERDGVLAAVDDQSLLVVALNGHTEDAPRLLVCRLDVLEAPGRPQLLHAAESRAADLRIRPGWLPARSDRAAWRGTSPTRPWPGP